MQAEDLAPWEREHNEAYWKEGHVGGHGLQFVDAVCRDLEFHSVLDAGCGPAQAVQRCAELGKRVVGLDISLEALHRGQAEACTYGALVAGRLGALPFASRTFDLVFCTDVLEHIPRRLIPGVISELVRVAGRYLFLTICLRPSRRNNQYHATLRSRSWWESHFRRVGCRKLHALVQRYQKVDPGCPDSQIIAHYAQYQMSARWVRFCQHPPFSFRGELEPWFFAFAVPLARAQPMACPLRQCGASQSSCGHCEEQETGSAGGG